MSAELIASTWLGDAAGSLELAAAVAVAAAQRGGPGVAGALLVELGERGPCRPTILASAPAREIEQALGAVPGARAAARGRICHLRLPADRQGVDVAAEALDAVPGSPLCVLHGRPERLRGLLESPRPSLRPRGALLRADLELDRPLAALAAADLCARGLRVRIAKRPLGWLAGRLALAGLPPGDAATGSAVRLLAGLLGEGRGQRVSDREPGPIGEDDVMLGSFYGHYPDEERA